MHLVGVARKKRYPLHVGIKNTHVHTWITGVKNPQGGGGGGDDEHGITDFFPQFHFFKDFFLFSRESVCLSWERDILFPRLREIFISAALSCASVASRMLFCFLRFFTYFCLDLFFQWSRSVMKILRCPVSHTFLRVAISFFVCVTVWVVSEVFFFYPKFDPFCPWRVLPEFIAFFSRFLKKNILPTICP